MSTERLRKQEWAETIDLIQAYYTEINGDYREKKGQMYCILGELYQDDQLISQVKELLDALELYPKMTSYNWTAYRLDKNPQLKIISLK